MSSILWITLLTAARPSAGKPGKSRAWLDRAEKVGICKRSKIKDLRALRFSERGAAWRLICAAPQHGFCAQVKDAGREIAEEVI